MRQDVAPLDIWSFAVRRLVPAVLVVLVTLLAAAPSATAGIWTPIDSGTSDTITTVDYQGGANLWYATTSGKLLRNGSQRSTYGGVSFNDIAFRPGGDVGIAVGSGGKLYRSLDGGFTWNGPTALTTKQACGNATPASSPLTDDLLAVGWANASTVYVVGQGKGEIQRSTDSGASWTEVGRGGAGGACRINDEVTDVQPVYGSSTVAFVAQSFGRVYLSPDALATAPAPRGSSVNNFEGRPRIALDPASPNRIFSADRASGRLQFQYSEDNGANFATQEIAPDVPVPAFYDVSTGPGVAIAVGNSGGIFSSIDGRTAYYQPADGPLATRDWKAVDLASAADAVVAGAGGAMVVTTRASTVPDLVPPAGTITGPTNATAGVPTTYTANVADNAGGSGINTGSFAWSATGVPNATGNPVNVTFPSPGYYSVRVAFADNAGNPGTATLGVTVRSAGIPTPPVIGDPTPPVSRTKTKSVTVAGGKITLGSPRACVPAGGSFTARLSFKRSKKKGTKFVKVTSVDFYIGRKKQGRTDKKAPFTKRLTVKKLKAGATYRLRARARIKVKRGKGPTKSISTSFKVCG